MAALYQWEDPVGCLGWSWNGGGAEYLALLDRFDANALAPWGNRLRCGPNGVSRTSNTATGLRRRTIPLAGSDAHPAPARKYVADVDQGAGELTTGQRTDRGIVVDVVHRHTHALDEPDRGLLDQVFVTHAVLADGLPTRRADR